MIVKLTRPVVDEKDSYAYVCDPEKPYFVYAVLSLESGKELSYMLNVWGQGSNDTIYDIPAKYFTVLDNTIPENWESGSYEMHDKTIYIQSFPEMAHDKYFYPRLMDGDPEIVKIFRIYQKQYEAKAQGGGVVDSEKNHD